MWIANPFVMTNSSCQYVFPVDIFCPIHNCIWILPLRHLKKVTQCALIIPRNYRIRADEEVVWSWTNNLPTISSGTLALEQISPKQPKLRSRPINPIITGVNIEVFFGQPRLRTYFLHFFLEFISFYIKNFLDNNSIWNLEL